MDDSTRMRTLCSLSIAAFAHKKREPGLLGMPSVFKPLARERDMSPARAAPGWSPPRAVLAGRDAPARVRARAALRGARQALVEAEVGRLWAESSRAADDADTQLESVTGQPQGQPHPTYIARGAPARALPARGRPATSPRPPR